MREFVVKKNDENQRLDKFLKKLMPDIPSSLIYKYLRKKCVRLNGKHCTDGSVILNKDDVLNLYVNDEFFEKDNVKNEFVYEEGTLDVVYEDENIILINKPSGVSVHPDEKQKSFTVIDNVIAYLIYKGEYAPESEQSFVPALCNRLDRNTKGIVIAAKNAEALREMNDIIKNREAVKRYMTLVHGIPSKKRDTLKHFLLKNEKTKEVKVYEKPIASGKTAVLEYEFIKSYKLKNGDTASLLEIELQTGRTHQIRAQLAYIGHSIIGDGKYGKSYATDKKNGFIHQALCAYRLSFKLMNDYKVLSYLNGKDFGIKIDFEV